MSPQSGALAQIRPDVDHTSVLKLLTQQQVVGSTVDPLNGDQNPYGLVYVGSKPSGRSVIKKGDLVVCNFNNKANVQGTGTTVDYISSAIGSKPKRLLQNSQLLGCASLAINSFDEVFAADSGAKNATGITAGGKITQTFQNSLLIEPWGSVYVPSQLGYPPGDGLWIADASSGKIVRINLGAGSQPTYTAVISGFAVNHGKPGNILGPSGMQYNAATDTLFVVDGVTNTLVAFSHAYSSLNGTNSIVVGKDGKTFSGPQKKYARLVHGGFPLDGPISSTLLPNGNLVLGNTLNKNGVNLLVEIATDGKVLDTKNVDTGVAGALFGIASTGTSDDTTKIYFNDDNDNNIQVLSKP
ncbi:MAG: hypothetical protein JOY69_01625 [Candidatus Eremiobacteraeota bacterium]|nr:hypothetical protein [Candidatus Eremiobacteraeota bacterium]